MKHRRLLLASIAFAAAAGVWAESAKKPPAARTREEGSSEARAPVAGQPFDDGELARYLEVEGRRLLKAGRVKPIETAARRCSLRLAEVPREKRPLTGTTPVIENATVVLGEFYREGKTLSFSSAAGGFLISEDGALVTSLHVVSEDDSRGFVAMLRDGRVFPVREAIAADPIDDVVIVRLDAPEGTKFPALALAAEPAPAGTSVGVMSHPEEHFYLLSTGVIGRHTLWREKKGDSHFMSISADFAKGSSGCPVFDERGAVVGVVNNTESIYYNDDGRQRQIDLQMVVRNVTPSWVVRALIDPVPPVAERVIPEGIPVAGDSIR